MTFITARTPIVGREVKTAVYDEKGNVKNIAFVAQFHRMKRKPYLELREKLSMIGQPVLDADGKPTSEVHQPPFETDLIFLQSVMAGWEGVDRDFSHDELADLLEEWPELAVPLATAFHEAHNAVPREKN